MLAMRLDCDDRVNSAIRFICPNPGGHLLLITFRLPRSPFSCIDQYRCHSIHVARCIRTLPQDLDTFYVMNYDRMSYCCLSLTQRSRRSSTWLPPFPSPFHLQVLSYAATSLRDLYQNCQRKSAFQEGYIKHFQLI